MSRVSPVPLARRGLCRPPAGAHGESHRPRLGFRARGFTLIELILVMALLTIAVSVTAPTLSRFFRGRSLDAEARQLLSLTREGQSRATSEGLPIDLWVDAPNHKVGLEVERTYELDQANDPRGVELDIDSAVTIEASQFLTTASTNQVNRNTTVTGASRPKVKLTHVSLPTIRFLPDGTVGESSPLSLRLTHAEGGSLWVAQAANHLSYEIREQAK